MISRKECCKSFRISQSTSSGKVCTPVSGVWLCIELLCAEYVVLENLTQRFNCPCILDLKVGTRQYGDYSTEAKKQKHIKTCAMSTSSALGVRFCGLQVCKSFASSLYDACV